MRFQSLCLHFKCKGNMGKNKKSFGKRHIDEKVLEGIATKYNVNTFSENLV